MLKLVYYILLTLFVVATNSCKTKKELKNSSSLSIINFEYIEEERFSSNFLTIKSSTSVDVPSQQKMTIQNYMLIKKGEYIWAVAKFFGLQAGKLFFNKDSIVILNNISRPKKADIYSYKSLSNLLGVRVSYHQIENIFLGNDWYSTKDYNIINIDSIAYLHTKDSNLAYSSSINEYFRPLNTIVKNTVNNNLINLNYSKYEKQNGKYFPKQLSIDISTQNNPLKIENFVESISLDSFNQPSFIIPSSYEIIKH